MELLQDISSSIQNGTIKQMEILITRALNENYPPNTILQEGVVAALIKMEKQCNRNEIFDTEILAAEWAMKAALEIIMPHVRNDADDFLGTIITGTLEGDIRETSKNIVSCLMQGQGLKVVDLGASVSTVRFIDTALEEKANIIACNAALTVFLPQMKLLVQAAAQADIRGKTKILLSGAPVTELFCKSIDADMYASDSIHAAKIAAEYCRKVKAK
ncbi:MAG: cobalamin-dependent protein [Treponema sp.]|nr:cobalamin-dependent protein [Treponema sp.]